MRLTIRSSGVSHRNDADTRGLSTAVYTGPGMELLAAPEDPYDFHETPAGWCLLLGQPLRYGLAQPATPVTARECLRQAYKSLDRFIGGTEGRYLAVLCDTATRTVRVFADPAGLQHAYYTTTPYGFCLATSITEVLRFRGAMSISPAALDLFLTFQYVPNSHTMFDGVSQVPLRAAVTYDRSQTTTAPYSLAEAGSGVSFSQQALAPAQIRDILLDSLRKQLPPDSAAVGAFLSGGIDSSTNVVLAANDLGVKPVVFTAGFRDADFDETPYAAIMADQYGLEHHIAVVDADSLRHLPAISALFDNPVADRAALPEFVLCQAASDAGITHMLSGEGGDEVLGYPRNLPDQLPVDLATISNHQAAQYYYGVSALMDESSRRALLPGIKAGDDYLSSLYTRLPGGAPFEKIYYGQWQTWLIENVLMKDLQLLAGAGMSFASPYISRTLMDYMSTLPLAVKLEGLHHKRFVRQALGDRLPAEIHRKPKHKFGVPAAAWFRTDAYGMLHDTVLATSGFCAQHLDAAVVRKLLTEHKSGHHDHNRALWALLFLEFWYSAKEQQVHG